MKRVFPFPRHILWVSLFCFALSAKGIEVSPVPEGKLCAFSFTYDDGVCAHYTHALPLHRKYGLPGTFLIITDRVEDDAAADRPHQYCSWTELKAMADAGMEIASHTKSHRNMREIESAGLTKEDTAGKTRAELFAMREPNWPSVWAEVDVAKQLLEERAGGTVRTLAFAGNACPDWTGRIREAAKCCVRAGNIRIATGRGDTEESLRKQLGEKVMVSNRVSCAMIHGLGTKESGDGWNPIPDVTVYESLLRAVSENADRIHVGTYAENAFYEARAKSTRLKAKPDAPGTFEVVFAPKAGEVCEAGDVWLRVATDETVSVNGTPVEPNRYGAVQVKPGDEIAVAKKEMEKQSEETNAVTMKVGDSKVFSLRENMTTGYQWLVLSTGGDACSVQLAHKGPPKTKPGEPMLCGAGGTAEVTVTARQPGTAHVHLGYARTWELEKGRKPVETFDIAVTVVPAP